MTESPDRNDQDDLGFMLEGEFNFPTEMRYFVANEKVHQWSDEAGTWLYTYLGGYRYRFTISKSELNRAHEPETEILLYIPPECKLVRGVRLIGRQHFDAQAKGIFPANISWVTPTF